MAERDPRAPRIRPVRTVNRIRPDYGGNVDVAAQHVAYDDSNVRDAIRDLDEELDEHGHTLNDLTDVDTAGVVEGDTIVYDEDTQTWLVGSSATARSSKVDVFTVADDTDDTFPLTFRPIADSWNVAVNGARVHAAEFAVVGRILAVADAADLFAGADTQGSPWDLEIQYDHLAGEVTPEGVTVLRVRYREVVKGDATTFWPVTYDDSAWTEAATPDVSFAGGPGGLPEHLYGWDPANDLQVRAVVEVTAGTPITLGFQMNDSAEVYWNGVHLGTWTIGTGTTPISGGDVLASNVLAIKAVDTNAVSCFVIVDVA